MVLAQQFNSEEPYKQLQRKIFTPTHHKVFDGSVKQRVVIVTLLTQLHEVFAGFWGFVAIQLKVQVPHVRANANISFL